MNLSNRTKSWHQHILPGVLILMPTLVALFVWTGLTRSFEFPKSLVFNGLVLFISLALTVAVFKKKSWPIPSALFKATPSKWVAAFWAIIFLSTIASPQRLHSIWGSFERGIGLVQWTFFVAFFFLTVLLVKKSHIKIALHSLLAGGTGVAAYAIAQFFGWDPLFSTFDVDFLEGRLFSTLGNPDFLAQYLAPLIALSFYFFWKEKRCRFLIPGVVMLLALLGTESRASFLALLGGVLLLCFVLVKDKKKFLWIGGLGFVALMGLVVLGSHFGLPLFDRFQFTPENFRSIFSRLLIWQAAFQLILEYPLLGIGPENFGIRFLEYVNSDFYYLEESFHITADRAHNELLDLGTIGGIPLMGIYLVLIAWVGKQLFRKEPLVQGIALALVVYFLQNQLSFSQVTHFVQFFFLLACLAVATHRETSFKWTPTRTFRWVGLPLIVLLVTFSFSSTILKPFYAEAWYTYALATEDTKQGLVNAIEYAPLQIEFRYNLLMWFPEERSEQLAALEWIEGRSIDVLAWQATGLSVVDPEASYALFEEVIALNPEYPHTQRAYADALYRNEQFERAAQEYERFLQIAPEFWTWCPDLEAYSEYEQKKYRIFYKNVSDFNNSLVHLYNSYVHIGSVDEANQLSVYLECFGLK